MSCTQNQPSGSDGPLRDEKAAGISPSLRRIAHPANGAEVARVEDAGGWESPRLRHPDPRSVPQDPGPRPSGHPRAPPLTVPDLGTEGIGSVLSVAAELHLEYDLVLDRVTEQPVSYP